MEVSDVIVVEMARATDGHAHLPTFTRRVPISLFLSSKLQHLLTLSSHSPSFVLPNIRIDTSVSHECRDGRCSIRGKSEGRTRVGHSDGRTCKSRHALAASDERLTAIRQILRCRLGLQFRLATLSDSYFQRHDNAQSARQPAASRPYPAAEAAMQ